MSYQSPYPFNDINYKLPLECYFRQLLPEGKIVYEYNALRNFRITENMYEYNNLYYTFEQIKDLYCEKNNKSDISDDDSEFQSWLSNYTTLLEPGAIIDLDTEQLGFNLNYPVSIECQPSYDGSVNLILNDGKNPPRLINTRFSCRELNTYEIIDRIGNNDTNIYDQGEQFDLDTSLFKMINKIPQIRFNGTYNGGTLPVGNYTLYIKYADADDNETDFVAESGIISCFIGNYSDPPSVNGGYREMSSNKYISISITNIDAAYDYIKVYYTRSNSDINQNEVTTAKKIIKKYPIINGVCNFNITGVEATEEIPISEINMQYFIASAVKAQAQCQNMLFQGNLIKPNIDYQDLQDCALRILPYVEQHESSQLIGDFNSAFASTGEAGEYNYMYYNPKNIYEHVGYYNHEIYRFGVVFIMKDGTLSPVFNTRGRNPIPRYDNLNGENDNYHQFGFWDKEDEKLRNRKYIEVLDETTYEIYRTTSGEIENSKGVVKLDFPANTAFPVYSIKFVIPQTVLDYLYQNLNVKGIFFVRQKRVPLIITQLYTMYKDQESNLPLINDSDGCFIERFLDDNRILNNDNYSARKQYVEKDVDSGKRTFDSQRRIGLCPEYITNQAHLNNLFQGTKYTLVQADSQPSGTNLSASTYNERLYTPRSYTTASGQEVSENTEVAGIPEGSDLLTIREYNFSSKAGSAEEPYKFSYIKDKNKSKDSPNLARGIYCSYLGLGSSALNAGRIYNVYSPEYTQSTLEQFKARYQDESPYYPISDRIGLEDIPYYWDWQEILFAESQEDSKRALGQPEQGYTLSCFRGDCFISYFTIRLNRNFQDPSAPNNDQIVDQYTWRDNYDPDHPENYENINRGDVNAIKLGSWIMLKILSPNNLSLRSLDYSYPDEEALTGHYRGFYPAFPISAAGNYKTPESGAINAGYGSTTGDKEYYILPDVPYIKNKYQTRIAYSQIAIGDAFQNGYRVFMQNAYRDYNTTYGGIMKLIELQGSLLCVFEHGTALIPVNERAVAGSGAGGDVFINTSNVLPENPRMLSDMYGTQWPESVIKTPYYVYGVDTVGKKIWRTNGQQFELISDFKVQKFLNDNISLSERELTPIIGIRNVKTHYNAFKQDVMFTFYDNLYGVEEKVWNLCYNELTQKFVTFYSWVPSYSENIDNIFFSFDRTTSKWISRLAVSSASSSSAEGVCVADPRIDQWAVRNTVKRNEEGEIIAVYRLRPTTNLTLENRPLPETFNTGITITYKYEWCQPTKKDSFPYNYFDIVDNYLVLVKDIDEKVFETKDGRITDGTLGDPVIYLGIKCTPVIKINSNSVNFDNRTDYNAGWTDYTSINAGYYESAVALTLTSILNNPAIINTYNDKGQITESHRPLNLTTDFWKHGQSGIIDIKDKLKPTFWYGKQHPFEFEFVVVADPSIHKIFDNLKIISNSAEPESFHFEVVGDAYSFSNDKKNMYFRQEATKSVLQSLGSDIIYDRDYVDIIPQQNSVSTIFPSYYLRKDTVNEIEDSYIQMTSNSQKRSYVALSGSEIVHDTVSDEYLIDTHISAQDIVKVGRIRGNMQYQEDHWYAQIPSIVFNQKNETQWQDNEPPLVINSVPDDITKNEITGEDLPNTYDIGQVSTDKWTFRKEARIRDKYIKIRIRYSGERLALITSIITMFTRSYA